MTEQEAIKVLTKAEKYRSQRVGRDFVDALAVAKTDIEKQIPKKPTYVDTRFRNRGRHIADGVSLDKCYKCPCCNSHIFHIFDSEKYCIHCGQALDWSDE